MLRRNVEHISDTDSVTDNVKWLRYTVILYRVSHEAGSVPSKRVEIERLAIRQNGTVFDALRGHCASLCIYAVVKSIHRSFYVYCRVRYY